LLDKKRRSIKTEREREKERETQEKERTVNSIC